MSPLRHGWRAAAPACIAPLVLTAAASAAYSPARIVAQLNAERGAFGIPNVGLNAKRSAACQAHNNYMRRNHSLGHFEQRGRPGYTAAGDRAARMSVLSGPRSGWARHNPWRNAPIHLAQVYNPGLRSTGVSDAYGYSCLFTYPNTRRRDPDMVWTLPNDLGQVAHAQTAFEGPAPPQSTVGIRAGRKTGPYLYVWSSASSVLSPLKRLVSGKLVGPNGPIAVKVIDSKRLNGLALVGNGWLLPVKPLKVDGMYTATVVLASSGGRTITHTWSFTATAASLTG